LVIQAVIIAAAVLALAFCWRNSHRGAGMTRLEALRTRMKIIFLILIVCGLCSKAVVHTYRHFNPPPPPIIGP
jgi:TRAP-type C4-dicarboxylate transport system permease small subunit